MSAIVALAYRVDASESMIQIPSCPSFIRLSFANLTSQVANSDQNEVYGVSVVGCYAALGGSRSALAERRAPRLRILRSQPHCAAGCPFLSQIMKSVRGGAPPNSRNRVAFCPRW